MRSIFTALVIFPIISYGQSYIAGNGPLYTSQEIPKIHIEIDPDSLAKLYLEENWYNNHEYPATFVFESELAMDTMENIGLRFRGNTSRNNVKKSFKVSFNTFVAGRKYQGVEKMNLNAEVNDPSMLRSRLCWDLFHAKHIPACRSNHTEVYINGDYYGLYQNIEHIDEEFVETWFGNKTGNLYKCTYPANLDFISNDPNSYKDAPFGSRTYELKTNTEVDDYGDLAEFIIFLNQASNTDFECGIYKYLNVYNYLKTAALDILTGNWDGYIYNQNNFYLYHNPLTDQFEYIPYDVDNTWGIDFLDRNWSNRNIYTWSQTGQPRPLFNRMMDVDSFREIFSWHIKDFIENHYHTPAHQQAAENLHEFITASALADPYRPLDYGYDVNDFLDALNVSTDDHVDFAIFPYADLRKTSASDQLQSTIIAPVIWRVEENFVDFPDFLQLSAIMDGPAAVSANLNFSIDGIQQESMSMELLDSAFSVIIALPANANTLDYNINVQGVNGLSRNAYCDSRLISFSQESDLVMNEVMTSNNNTISDGEGEFDDWIELYNAGSASINLSEYYLSDNNRSSSKFHLPDISIEAGEFLIFWADSELEQGSQHCNFKLSASGERLYLFRDIADGIELVDHIQIPVLPSDFSYGRVLDASLPWVLFANTTPGFPNGVLGTGILPESNTFSVFPNPATDFVFMDTTRSYKVYDGSGRLSLEGIGRSIDLQGLAKGIYILRNGSMATKFVKL